MRDAGAHSPHFFLQNFLNLSLVISAKTSASVAYLWTFDGWLLSAVAGAGLAACSELGLETCSLIFKVIDGCNEAICAYHDDHCGPAMRSAAALWPQETASVSSARNIAFIAPDAS